MRKLFLTISVLATAVASIVFAGSTGMPRLPERSSEEQTEPKRSDKYVDMRSDAGRQTQIGGNKVLIAVGNFVAHHNGTVITCDSTVRYSDSHLECFGNVLINKGTTYIYGDRAEYDGQKNEANIYSDIVKVVDGTATMYTYNFTFNTKSNVGTYKGGGVVVDEKNRLESDRGYYNADTKDIICVERVQLRDDKYKLKGDSIIYNMESNNARFFTNTHIWNTEENEYLYADCGEYHDADQLYRLTKNGYILTETQEVWSDSLDYYRDRGYALLRHNIQIDDTDNKIIALGDWGEYWKEPGNAFLTSDPVMVSYDTEQGDSLYIRSDSMFLYHRDPVAERIARKIKADSIARADSLAKVAQQAEEAKQEEQTEEVEQTEDTDQNEEVKQPEDTKQTEDVKPQSSAPKQIGGNRAADKVGKNNKNDKADKARAALEQSKATRGQQGEAAQKPQPKKPLEGSADMPKGEDKGAGSAVPANIAVNPSLKQPTPQSTEKTETQNPEPQTPPQTAVQPINKPATLPTIQPSAQPATQPTEQPGTQNDAQTTEQVDATTVDTLATDSMAVDSLTKAIDTLTTKQRRALEKAAAKALKQHIRDSIKKVKADSLRVKLDTIAARRQAKRTAYYKKLEYQDSVYKAKARIRADKALRRKVLRLERRGIVIQPVHDSVFRQIDSIIYADSVPRDSLVRHMLDSLIEKYFPRKAKVDTTALQTDTMPVDSSYKLIMALGRVRMYRSDAQMVCDSLIVRSTDSIIHLYKNPVLWSDENQIFSDSMHIFNKEGKLSRAQFEGHPMIVAQIDTAHYNQIAGKEIVSHFNDKNELYRNDVNGNVQTIYYMQEQDSPEITMMAYIESGDMTAYLENRQLRGITYRTNPTYFFYPIDKIPEDRDTRLKGFRWEESRRPAKDSVLNRTLRPSIREIKSRLQHPTFPIEQGMQLRRQRLTEQGRWKDRTDTLSIETIEWVESVQY